MTPDRPVGPDFRTDRGQKYVLLHLSRVRVLGAGFRDGEHIYDAYARGNGQKPIATGSIAAISMYHNVPIGDMFVVDDPAEAERVRAKLAGEAEPVEKS